MNTDGSGQQRPQDARRDSRDAQRDPQDAQSDKRPEGRSEEGRGHGRCSTFRNHHKEKDTDLGLFMDTFDNLLEKDEMKKLEQDFVDSNPKEQAWKPSPPTSSSEEDSSSDEEEEEPIAGPSAKVSKFIDMVLSPSNFFFFSNYLLQRH
jgi:hypothetical protein